MVLPLPCLFSSEQNKQAIICGNYKLLSAGVTSELSAMRRYHKFSVCQQMENAQYR